MTEQVWNCQISRKAKGSFQASINDLTVGEKFYLQCQNTTNTKDHTKPNQKNDFSLLENKDLQQNITIFFKTHSWPQYVLKPVRTLSVSDNHILLEVTSYIPGRYNANQGLFLQKAESIITIEGFSWNTNSSLSKDSQQQMAQAQPHPIHGLIKIPSPYLEIVFWIAAFLALLITVIFIFRKIKKQKEEFNDIENLKTLRSPLYEFYHAAKKIERKHVSLSNTLDDEGKDKPSQKDSQEALRFFYRGLNHIFRKFLAVQLEFPAHIWSSQKSLRYLKKQYSDTEIFKHIKSTLYELNQMASSKNPISEEDCHKNLSFCKEVANQIVQLQKKKEF